MGDDVTAMAPPPCDVMRATEPPPHVEFYEMARLVTGLAIYPLVCVVGLAGNSLALVWSGETEYVTVMNYIGPICLFRRLRQP